MSSAGLPKIPRGVEVPVTRLPAEEEKPRLPLDFEWLRNEPDDVAREYLQNIRGAALLFRPVCSILVVFCSVPEPVLLSLYSLAGSC